MHATEIIAEEHRWIRHLLDCLEKVVEASQVKGHLDPEASSEMLCLFEYFADGQHQRKEEQVLVPALLRRANISQKSYIGKLLADHEEERRRMQGMRINLLGAIYGEPLCVREFAHYSRAYVELHRKHMAHENTVLLPMAERILTTEDDRAVLNGFHTMDANAPREPGWVAERIRVVCERLGVPMTTSGGTFEFQA